MSMSGASLSLGNLSIGVEVNTAGADAAFSRLRSNMQSLDSAFSGTTRGTTNLGGAFTSAGRSATSFGDTLRNSALAGAAFEVGMLAMRTALSSEACFCQVAARVVLRRTEGTHQEHGIGWGGVVAVGHRGGPM